MSAGDYAEIRRMAQGPTPETTHMTLVVTFTFSYEAVDCFKALIPTRHRAWLEEYRSWYATPAYLDAIKEFARDFDGAMFIDGNRWENLRTGTVSWQLTLFEDA